jgi:hypothetical protein
MRWSLLILLSLLPLGGLAGKRRKLRSRQCKQSVSSSNNSTKPTSSANTAHTGKTYKLKDFFQGESFLSEYVVTFISLVLTQPIVAIGNILPVTIPPMEMSTT